MRNRQLTQFIAAMIATATLALPYVAQAQKANEGLPLAKEKWIEVQLRTSVVGLDIAKREVTLKGPEGNLLTVAVGEHVKRLNEFEVGDIVDVEYVTFLRADFREPTAAEKAEPLVVLAGAGKAPKEVAPAGEVGAVVKAVVKVVAVDTDAARVLIQGPRGNFVVLPVEDKAILKNLKVGESVVMTYAEAMAASLQKVEPKPEVPEGSGDD